MSIISAGTSNTSTLVYTGDTTGNLVFQTNGTTEAMRITSGQNIGIGTSNPSERLDIQGTTDLKARIYTTGNTITTHAGVALKTGSYEYIIQNFTTTAGSVGALRFYDITAGSERMRITSGGDIGIGTNSPSQKLHVAAGTGNGIQISSDGTTAGAALFLQQTQTSNYTWRMAVGGGDNAWVTGRSLFFRDDNSSAVRMVIDTSGRVTMPSQPAFMQVNLSGYNSVGYLKGSGSTVNLNRGGHYNSTNGRFTAPIAGTYMFMCGVLVETNTGRLEGNISVNGTIKVNFNGTGTTYDGPTGTLIIDLNAGDYVDVRRQSGTAHSDGGHPNTYFGGYLLG